MALKAVAAFARKNVQGKIKKNVKDVKNVARIKTFKTLKNVE